MIVFVSDLFGDQYDKGGAELTTQAIIRSSLFPCGFTRLNSFNPNLLSIMKEYKHAFWVFGNFSLVSAECLMYTMKNLNYSVLEYDYKYCRFRSPGKHKSEEGECDCSTHPTAKLISMFLYNADITWWMSHKQLEIYQSEYPFLRNDNNKVLSSVFADKTLDYIESLDTSNKEDTWLILNSKSWVKGVEDAVEYAVENNLNYELVWGLEHFDLLEKLAKSKGIIFFPRADDTCPRMTIEAKLLDCEMVLNDHVQHKDEDWFANKHSTMKYLRKSARRFWNEIEKTAQQATNIPECETVENLNPPKFKFIIPFYNCEEWISKTIESLKRQKYENFDCVLIDDMSIDKSVEVIKHSIVGDARFSLIENNDKKYALANIAMGIEQTNCDDDDVIILLDGDDWLASTRTLTKLCNVYVGDTLMTYGSYVLSPEGLRGPEPSQYPDKVIKDNSYREDQWRASHLRTFKHKLWRQIKHEDLKDASGNYYEMTYDQAIMLPLLEMAQERAKFIPEVLYVYNKENPLNVDKIKAKKQFELAQEIRGKQPYERI